MSAILSAKWTTGIFSCILAVRDSGLNIIAYVDVSPSNIRTTAQDGTTHVVVTNDKTYNDGSVHVIGISQAAVTKTLKLYVDGVLKGSTSLVGARPSGSTMAVNIACNTGGVQPFSGTLDEIALFSKLLTDAQMADLSNIVHNGHT